MVKYRDRFIRDVDPLQPFTNVFEIRYTLKPGLTKLPRAKYWRWSEKEAAVLLDYKKKNANFLQECNSPVSSLPLLVKKKDGR